MGLVSKSSGVLAPASSYLKSEIRIIAELADATFAGEPKIAWLEMADDYDLIRERIEQVIPGFENFLEAIYEHGFLELPHAVRDRRQFDTRGGKARFTVHRPEAARAPAGQFIMMTIRSHDQFNTTVYSQADRYRGIANNRRVVFMNAADIQAAGLQPEMKVSLTSQTGRATRTMSGFSVMPYDIPSGCVATYYPETNALIPIDRVAAGSNTPAYKSVPVSIRPVS
jgi:anaerobic selenocysteine-containing dehydrogenase